MNYSFENDLVLVQDGVNKKLKQILSEADLGGNAYCKQILDAMAYCTIDSGKRIRAFIIIKSCKMFKVDDEVAFYIASCVEILHAYSLVHDDLPALDNSDERRGRPSLHKHFTESTAILAGDALLTFVFELLSSSSLNITDISKLSLINRISKAAGYNGMIAGQVIDIDMQNNSLLANKDSVLVMQALKTGELFAFCFAVGAIVAGSYDVEKLRVIGFQFGKLYQIIDDIKDAEEDGANSFLSSVNFDTDRAYEEALIVCKEIKTSLSLLVLSNGSDGYAEIISLIDYVVDIAGFAKK